MKSATIGIIGGTGLGDLLFRETAGKRLTVDTPFGPPSADPVLVDWNGRSVVFLARHGEGHRFNPTNVPYRANLWAMKSIGVSAIIASGATGSLREDIEPGHLVLCDQVIDKTTRRVNTFFEEGIVAHVEFADPFCPWLRALLTESAASISTTVHHAGTYVCMEGPQFSTRAESHLHRQMGGDLIGMTCLPEAKLAREAEICYATVAMVTDFDCWHDDHQDVDITDIIRVMTENSGKAARLVARLARDFPREHEACPIGSDKALEFAIITAPEARDPALVAKLDAVAGRVLAKQG
jgi:5'-methylthioadenosine phosphorylase